MPVFSPLPKYLGSDGTPHRIEYGPLVNYGYSGETGLPFEVTVPPDWPAGRPVPLRAEAEILVCEKFCIPVSGKLALDVPTGAKSVHNPRQVVLARRGSEVSNS